jgi:hypothetical protein
MKKDEVVQRVCAEALRAFETGPTHTGDRVYAGMPSRAARSLCNQAGYIRQDYSFM